MKLVAWGDVGVKLVAWMGCGGEAGSLGGAGVRLVAWVGCRGKAGSLGGVWE